MNSKTWLFLPLVVIGATWGLTIPAIKIAVSVGYPVLGVLFWQVFLAAFVALILFFTKTTCFKVNKEKVDFIWLDNGIWNNITWNNNLHGCFSSSSGCHGNNNSNGSNFYYAYCNFDRSRDFSKKREH